MTLDINDGQPFLPRSAGMTSDDARRLLHNGEIRRVTRGVYVSSATPDGPVLRAQAVRLVLPQDAVVSGVTAAWLYGVPPLMIAAGGSSPPVHVLRPSGRSGSRRSDCAGSSRLLSDDDVHVVRGLAVTTPARTAVDLARTLDRPDGLAYLDAMLTQQIVCRAAVLDRLKSTSGLPGVVQARELMDLAEDDVESPMESHMRLRYVDAGFPRPVVQHKLWDGHRFVARFDCALPSRRYAFEYDGEEFHGPEHVVHDAARRARACALGWHVDAFRREHVLGRSWAFEEAVSVALGIEPQLLPYERRRRSDWRWRASDLSLSRTPCAPGDTTPDGA